MPQSTELTKKVRKQTPGKANLIVRHLQLTQKTFLTLGIFQAEQRSNQMLSSHGWRWNASCLPESLFD